MYRIFFTLIIAALVSFSCSKDSKNTTDTKQQDNKQKQIQQSTDQNKQESNTQQSSTQNTGTQQQGTTGVAYNVKSTGGSVTKSQMVDFTWDENGNEIKLSDYKGKVILVNFWATWCPPCRKELPDLSAISTELKDKNFKMIGVSVDDNKDVLDKFLETNKLPYTIVFEPTELVSKYMEAAGQNQNVVPQTYIIDKNGKVVEAILGSRSKADFLSLINKYL